MVPMLSNFLNTSTVYPQHITSGFLHCLCMWAFGTGAVKKQNKKKEIVTILKWKDKYAGKSGDGEERVEKSCAEDARSVCNHTCVCRAADVFTHGHACVHAPDPVSQWKLVAGKWNSVTQIEHSASQHENYFSRSNPTINPFSSYTYFIGICLGCIH